MNDSKHDYQLKGFGPYGASMGRRSDLDSSYSGAASIRRVPLDEGGYDPGGAYWGAGKGVPNLFCIEGEEAELGERADRTSRDGDARPDLQVRRR